MANPAVDDVNTRLEPTKPNPLAPAPLEQAGKPTDVAKDSSAKFESQLPSRNLPEKGTSDATAVDARIQSDRGTGISPGTAVKLGDQTGMMYTNDKGTTFTTPGGQAYNLDSNGDGTYKMTSKNGDGQTIANAKMERAPDSISARSESPSSSLALTDGSKKFTDPSTTDFKITGVDAVTPTARSENVRPNSDGQGRTEAGQAGPKSTLPDAPAPSNPQKTAQEANVPVISAVTSRSDASRATTNPDTGEVRPPAVKVGDTIPSPVIAPLRPEPVLAKPDSPVAKLDAPTTTVNQGLQGIVTQNPVTKVGEVAPPAAKVGDTLPPPVVAPLRPEPVLGKPDSPVAKPDAPTTTVNQGLQGIVTQNPVTKVGEVAPPAAKVGDTLPPPVVAPLRPEPVLGKPDSPVAKPDAPTTTVNQGPQGIVAQNPVTKVGEVAPPAAKVGEAPGAPVIAPGSVDKSGLLKPQGPADAGLAKQAPPDASVVKQAPPDAGVVKQAPPDVSPSPGSLKGTDTGAVLGSVNQPADPRQAKPDAPLSADKGAIDKTQTPNPNAPANPSGGVNPNAPTLDKGGVDPGKTKGIDVGAADASPRPTGPMGAASGAKGFGDGSGTLDKQGQDGQPKIASIDGIKDTKDANLAKVSDGIKAINTLDPQSQAVADWQNMHQQWLQNRGAMQQALLANALNPNGLPGALQGGLDMDQRRAQWLANRQAMLDVAGLSGLNPNAMTPEQRMLQMNLNRQSMADGIAAGALDPMQMRAMMIQQWQLQRQMLLDQSAGINSPDFLAMRQQWLQNQLLMRNQMQDGTGTMMPQDMMRQMMLQRMAEFLRNQTTTDQLAMGVGGRMYSELNRVRDAAGQAEGAGRVPLSELINRRLENQQGNQLVSNLNLAPPSRLDSTLPSRADMQNLTNPALLTSRSGFEPQRHDVRHEPVTRPELAGKDQKDNLQNSVRRAAESVIETAAGAKAAHDAAKKIEHRIDNVILGIRQNEIENISTQQSAAGGRTSEVANVANNSNTDAALLAVITARQLKEEKDLKERLLQAEKAKKKDDGKRRKIVVKEKDTLDSICKRYLRDVRLVPLIYEINAHILQAKARIKKSGEVQLVAGTILWLPSTTEIETFRGKLATGFMPEIKSNEKELTAEEELAECFGKNWDGVSSHDSPSEEDQIRRQNIESLLGPLSKNDDTELYYICRLGDTLKSIAVKHPALKDPSLWKLIAEINGLATAVDKKGVPIAKIVRGSKIRIPAPDEVAAYLVDKRRVSQSKADEFVSNTTFPGAATTVVDPERPIEHKINSLKDAGALMLQSGGFKPRTKPLSEALTDPLSPTGAPAVYLSVTEFERSQAQLLENSKAIENVRALSDDCRIVRRHLAHFDGSRSFQAQLDVMVNGDWKVALVYNVSDTESWCQRFTQEGKVEKVKIQLPTSAIHQMLENDVNSNWQLYRDQMIG